jgi:hypothetical protein
LLASFHYVEASITVFFLSISDLSLQNFMSSGFLPKLK